MQSTKPIQFCSFLNFIRQLSADETVAELSDVDENATEHWGRELEKAICTGNVKGAETLILANADELKEITESFPLHEAAERGKRDRLLH